MLPLTHGCEPPVMEDGTRARSYADAQGWGTLACHGQERCAQEKNMGAPRWGGGACVRCVPSSGAADAPRFILLVA